MRITKTALLCAAAPIFMPTIAVAQTGGDATDPDVGQETTQAASVEYSGDIIVTARKRDERLLDVPVAVSAVSGEQLERYAVNSLDAISQQVPQLIIAETQNQVGGSINLRGIGAGISNPSTESAVTLNIDGIPISYGNAIRLGQIDLGQVEVLKGPQALFYGKNSPGGIISLISQDPGPDYEAKVRIGYEFAANEKFAEGVMSGPISETLGARVVAYYSDEEGYFRNVAVPIPGITPGPGADSYNSKSLFVRGTLKYDSMDGATRAKVKVAYANRKRDGVGPTGGSQIVDCAGETSVFGATDCDLDRGFYNVILPQRLVDADPEFRDGVPFTNSKQFVTSLAVDQDLGETMTVSSVTGYYRLDEESVDSFSFSNIPYFAASNDIAADGFSQELRLASDLDGPLQFLAGGFYQDANFTIRQAFGIDFGTPFIFGSTFYDVHTKATSLFGQLRYDLTEQLELAAGGRYSWETKSLTGTSFGSPFEVLDPKQKYNDFSPEVTLTYKPTFDTTIYAAYREGFTSGGFNTAPAPLRSEADQSRPALDLSYGQMTARGGELGVKGYLGGRQFTYDAVGYYYKYKGLQLSRYDNESFTQLTQNAGGARSQGFELALTAEPDGAPGLRLNAALAYNDAKYTDFIGGCYAGQSIDAGCNLNPDDPTADPSTFGTAGNNYNDQDLSGQTMFRAPKFTFNAGAVYDHEFSDNLGGSAGFDVSYSDSYLTQTEGNPRNFQPSYWILDGQVSINSGPGKNWELSLIGRNLTNEKVIVAGSIVGLTASGTGTNNTTPGDILGGIGSRRSVILQLTIRN